MTKLRHAAAAAGIALAVMHNSYLAAFLLPLSLLSVVQAQVQVPVNPRATYLRINNDPSALPAPAVPISALGVGVGQWVRITTTGNYSQGGSDVERNLIGVFSSTPTLLINATGQQSRVPDAVTAGPWYVSQPTSTSSLATDIPQDFVIGRTGWSNGTLVKVPAGATHIFLSTFRNNSNTGYFSSNSDPNNDYVVVFTPVSPATLQGTAEHVELRTAINGTPTATPDVKQASPFTTLSVDVVQRFGYSSGEVWLLAANIFPTGGTAPIGPLPDFHMGSSFVIAQVGVTATAAGQWSFFIPPSNAGTTLVLQGCFLSSVARNGLLQGSDGHRIELQ